MLLVFIAFGVLFGGLFGLHILLSLPHLRSRALPPLSSVIGAVIAMEAAACTLMVLHFGIYSSNGIGSPGTKLFAVVLASLAEIAFVCILALVAKGCLIPDFATQQRWLLGAVVLVFVFQYFALYVWAMANHDRADNQSVFSTVPGAVVVAIRLVVTVWFGWSICRTQAKEQQRNKQRFFLWFGCFFSIWFLGLPLAAVISTQSKPWQRDTVVEVFSLTFNLVFFATLVGALQPDRGAALARSSLPPARQDNDFSDVVAPYEDL
eukprot:c20234_g1_i5.p1 GENE.c20234_g1_i5~~c20234_g1_i5.p1  ORF type:complete len:264 (-),score=62.05 c20234_g1_i5:77-868(-)